jgi:hypothetical protein
VLFEIAHAPFAIPKLLLLTVRLGDCGVTLPVWFPVPGWPARHSRELSRHTRRYFGSLAIFSLVIGASVTLCAAADC